MALWMPSLTSAFGDELQPDSAMHNQALPMNLNETGDLQPVGAKRCREEEDDASAAPAKRAAEVPRPVGLGAASDGVVREPQAPQALQGHYGEVLYPFPDSPTRGPLRDAWTGYRERDHLGVFYRSFLPTDPAYGEWSGFGFTSDGSAPYNFNSGRFSEKSTSSDGYRCVKLAIEGSKTNRIFMIHVGVAYLFGARKLTAYPMSLLLVVDHIEEGDKANFRFDNLQIMTQLQNVAKATNIKEVAKGNGAVLLPEGDAAGKGWFGEPMSLYAFSDRPTSGPLHDAWTGYRERDHLGVFYRSFLPTDPAYGEWSGFGFTSDGSAPYNFNSGRFWEKSTSSDGYRCVKLAIEGSKTNRIFMIHVGVAYLFGASKITDYPMSQLLVVDHIAEGDKANFRFDNLQIMTQLQNTRKAMTQRQNTRKAKGIAKAAGAGAGAGAGVGTTFGAGIFP